MRAAVITFAACSGSERILTPPSTAVEECGRLSRSAAHCLDSASGRIIRRVVEARCIQISEEIRYQVRSMKV